MAKLYSECTVHVHCAKNASIYTMNYFGDLETSLVSKYTPLFFLFAEIHFSACFLHVHVFCMFCMFCMFPMLFMCICCMFIFCMFCIGPLFIILIPPIGPPIFIPLLPPPPIILFIAIIPCIP